MSYITTPRSIVTATYIRADYLNENFEAFTNGLSAGLHDLNMANVETTGKTTASTVALTGDRTIGGAAKGQRVGILMHRWIGQGLQGAYSTFRMDNGAVTTNEPGAIYMDRSGSIVGHRVWIQVTSFTGGETFTIQYRKNGTTVASASAITIAAATTYTTSGSWSRGEHSFSAGDRWSCYFSGAGALRYTCSGSILLEVVFDE
jgi:hypothetical protein